jgi:hypothetical protein
MTRIACFMAADLPSEVIASCLRLASSWDGYSRKPLSGYTYEPDPGSIYDLLKRYRGEDYWRHIFDSRCRSHFHERGGTGPFAAFRLRTVDRLVEGIDRIPVALCPGVRRRLMLRSVYAGLSAEQAAP